MPGAMIYCGACNENHAGVKITGIKASPDGPERKKRS